MNSLDIRIHGAQKRIETLNQRIERYRELIKKKRDKINSGQEENHRYWNGRYVLEVEIEDHIMEIESAKRMLTEEKRLLEECREKKRIQNDKEHLIPRVEAVDEFLQNWGRMAYEWYLNQLEKCDDYIKDELWRGQLSPKQIKVKVERMCGYQVLKIWKTYKDRDRESLNEEVKKIVDDEIEIKRIDLYYRCIREVGTIINANRIYLGNNGSLYGIVEGELGQVKIETQFNGGNNEHCLHYRVLVRKV